MKCIITMAICLIGLGGSGLMAQDSGGPMTLRLASQSIRYAQVIEAHDIELTEGTSIDEAVKVNIHACHSIVFGEGFRLAPGAEMVATVEESCKDAPAEAASAMPIAFSVGPNPFIDRTTMRIDLPNAAILKIQIYDLQGRMVAEPVPGAKLDAGKHQIQLNLPDLPSGSYFYRALAGEVERKGKLILLD